MAFAMNSSAENFKTDRITPNPAAKTSAIRTDPATEPSHSSIASESAKYAQTQATA
jgi:hypothetical protein